LDVKTLHHTRTEVPFLRVVKSEITCLRSLFQPLATCMYNLNNILPSSSNSSCSVSSNMLLNHNVQLDDSITLTIGRKFGGLNVSKFGQKQRFIT